MLQVRRWCAASLDKQETTKSSESILGRLAQATRLALLRAVPRRGKRALNRTAIRFGRVPSGVDRAVILN